MGESLPHLPSDVARAWREVRICSREDARGAAAMMLRNIIAHVAVDKDAESGKTFAAYVEYLAAEGWLPRGAQPWVDELRRAGNARIHDLEDVSIDQLQLLMATADLLLRNVYVAPAELAESEASGSTAAGAEADS